MTIIVLENCVCVRTSSWPHHEESFPEIAAKSHLQDDFYPFAFSNPSAFLHRAHPRTVSAGTPAAQDQAPGMSTNVNEVSLDLVVHDKHHNAILDLKPDDLLVTDDGIPVKLTGFHLVSADAAASRGHLVTLLFDHIQGPTAKSARIIAQKILSVLPTTGYSFSVLQFQDRLRVLQSFTEDRQAVAQAVNVVTESHPIVASSSINLSVNIINDQTARTREH